VASAGGLEGTLVAQGVSEANAKAMAKLYTKALAGEKTIHFYGISALPLRETFDAFEETFPELKVVGTQLNSPDTITRVTAEQSSGQVAAGVVNGTSNVISALDENKFVTGYKPLAASNLSKAGVDAAGYYANVVSPYGAVYNNSLKKDEAPKAWTDIINSRFDGQVTAVDPTIVGVMSTALIYLSDGGVLDEAALKRLAALDPKFYPDTSSAINAVGSGEREVMFAQSYSVFKVQQAAGNLPIKFAFPMSDGNVVQQFFLAIPKKVTNKSASQLLIDYLFTPHAQQLSKKQGYIPTLKAQPAGDLFPAIDDIPNPLGGPSIESNAAGLKKWVPVFAKVFKD